MELNEQKSILDMALGSIKERTDYEMSRIIGNIKDINTEASKVRELNIKIKFVADSSRQQIGFNATVSSKLQPTSPVVGSLTVYGEAGGGPLVVENTPQIPGQVSMDGSEERQPAVLKLVKIG